MRLIGILRGDEVQPLSKRQFNHPAFGSKAVSSCPVVTLTLLADYQRLDRRAQLLLEFKRSLWLGQTTFMDA
jgi:hypothetical protein